MAALVEVRVFHGASPALGSDVTAETLRFKGADDDAQDASAPVEVPSSGYAYSWRKSLKLVAVTPPDNALRNLRFYSDGVSLGTDRTVLYATSTSYAQASAADEEAPISAVDADSYTEASPAVLQAGDWVDDADSVPTDGGTLQPYVQLQLRVGTAALAGAASAKTVVWLYDET